MEWYWRAGSGSMADVAMQKGKRKDEAWASSDWCWKAAAAFYDYLMDGVDAWMGFFRLRNLLKSKPHRR